MGSPTTDIAKLMEDIRAAGPSWKTDVSLECLCNGMPTRWRVNVQDIWGHINSPDFQGADAVRTLQAARDYVVRFVATFNDEAMPWVDDDGVVCWERNKPGAFGVDENGEVRVP